MKLMMSSLNMYSFVHRHAPNSSTFSQSTVLKDKPGQMRMSQIFTKLWKNQFFENFRETSNVSLLSYQLVSGQICKYEENKLVVFSN
jgi:hypothetical protein